MPDHTARLEAFLAVLDDAYRERFPASAAHFERHGRRVLDGTSHAIRWNRPFMPVIARADGSAVEDLDGHRIVDYWQGHFANVLGHNPAPLRQALGDVLAEGRGLQSGMLHAVEADVSQLICAATGAETVRLTTSGSLGTFYATLLARGFTGREQVLKVAGGWHGSQPFGLKGVVAQGRSFDHLESEGLSESTRGEIILTRFNDVEDLRRVFRRVGDRIACFLLEPMLGAGGGIAASVEYLQEARELTRAHGALLLCDEIITGWRFRAGDLASLYGVRPDLWILGKVIGGGMPVAAVAGRRDVLRLCTRGVGRVKFEGGTYSGHELSLVAAATMLRRLKDREGAIYSTLGRLGELARGVLAAVQRQSGIRMAVPAPPPVVRYGSSLVYGHPLDEDAVEPSCPEQLAAGAHPTLDEALLKSALLLEDVSVHYGVGAVSTAHRESEIEATGAALTRVLERVRRAGLL